MLTEASVEDVFVLAGSIRRKMACLVNQLKDRITPHAHFFSEWFSGGHAIMTE